MIAPVDDGDAHRRAGKRARAFEPAEAGADDDDMMHGHCSSAALISAAVPPGEMMGRADSLDTSIREPIDMSS